ncbi:hypothetical protein DMUE_0293 [Dictyocoela muelleri]|nr:hypothetical protein DMUE_0293 [Dictyocoela muelleri]
MNLSFEKLTQNDQSIDNKSDNDKSINNRSDYNPISDKSGNNKYNPNSDFIPTALSSKIGENIICGIYAEQRNESEPPLEISCVFYNRNPDKENHLSTRLFNLIEKNILTHPLLKIKINFYFLYNKESDFISCINLYTSTILRSGLGSFNMIFGIYKDQIQLCASDNKIVYLVVDKEISRNELKNELEGMMKDVVDYENNFKNEFIKNFGIKFKIKE